VARPALTAAIERSEDRPLRQLLAGHGWGKTTVAAAWARAQPTGWYAVDSTDRDATTIAAGLASAWPTPAWWRPDVAEPAALAASLAAAWAPAGPVRLVLDDLQALRDSEGFTVVRGLLAVLGPSLRLTVTTSEDLGLVDARARAAASVFELDATDLAMDAATVGTLLAGELDEDPALAARIADATGGWPAAVRLVLESLRTVAPSERSARVGALTGPAGPVASYQLGVVLPSLAPDDRRTLLQLALLGRVPVPTYAAVTGVGLVNASGRIGDLAARGLVRLTEGDEVVVDLAPVVERVLRTWDDRAAPREALVADLVAGLVEQGEVARALVVLRDAGQPAALAALLERHGDALLRAGSVRDVAAAAAAVPVADRTPTIERLHGHALAYRGEWSSALTCLTAAGVQASGPLPVELALPLGLAHHLGGDLAGALRAYARAEGDGDRDGLGPEAAVLAAWHATAHWLRGEPDAARPLADRALAAAERLGDDRARAHAHTAHALLAASDGDRRANEANYRQALAAAERASDRLQLARILTNLGSHYLEDGRYADATRETNRAIDLASAIGYTPILGVAWCNRAEIALRTGAVDQAVADATSARELFARLRSRTESYAEHLLGDARREQGELVLARIAYERAIRLAEPAGDHQGLVPAHIGLAKTLLSTDPDVAAEIATRALDLDTGMARPAALLANAWVALVRNERGVARALASDALEVAERREDRARAAEAVTCLALVEDDPTPLLREAAQRWAQVDAPISRTRVELGLARRSDRPEERARVPALERRLAAWGCPPDRGTYVQRIVVGTELQPLTTIRVLGGFVVERAGRPVPRSAWGSRKARDLLKLLVVRNGRRVTREELADLLWPDEPYEVVTNRLSVALSVVRGILTPEGAPKDAAAIRTDGDTIRLDHEAVDVDLLRFRRLAEEGLRAARAGRAEEAVAGLAVAEEAYGGDLLEEDHDARWLVDRREEMRSLYVSVSRTLAGLVTETDPDLALRLLLRVLDRDPYDEPAHLDSCRALLRAGRHGEARRRYQLYSRRMAELDLPAVPFHDLHRPGAEAGGADGS
jgi:DNA-binding SARP family transcriptional activator/tetratricopeptide (TPR) repeat protein